MKKEAINKNQLRLVKGGQQVLTTTSSAPSEPCPKCGGTRFRLLYQGYPFHVWECLMCGSRMK